MYNIFITCGTSILTNAARKKESSIQLGRMIVNNSNAKSFSDMDAEASKALNELVNSEIEEFVNVSEGDACKKSAELNCLLNWLRQNNISASLCYCYLIHTDTELGSWTARLIEDWLKEHGFMGAESNAIKGLNTSTIADFESGLSELVQWAFQVIPKDEDRPQDVHYIFNVAGGFKSMSGFMQILGQFLADETIYTFEGGKNEVLSIPKLSIRWEDSDTSIASNFDDYHRISLGIKPWKPHNLNFRWVQHGKFTPWGRIAWESAKDVIYRSKIQTFVCDQVVEGKEFRESVMDLDPLRRKIVNERLDDLCLFVMSGKTQNTRRLDYKQIKGNYPWSNECDAWADGSAKRLFCNERGNGCVVVECLHDALH